MAHKKAGSSSKNGRDSVGQRLGVKAGDGQLVPAGSIIVRQRGMTFLAGEGTGLGRDYTVFATVTGRVRFEHETTRQEAHPRRADAEPAAAARGLAHTVAGTTAGRRRTEGSAGDPIVKAGDPSQVLPGGGPLRLVRHHVHRGFHAPELRVDVCSQLPPVLHGQADDRGHGRPGRAVPEAPRALGPRLTAPRYVIPMRRARQGPPFCSTARLGSHGTLQLRRPGPHRRRAHAGPRRHRAWPCDTPTAQIVWAAERRSTAIVHRNRSARWPFVRGLVVLYETLVIGTQWLMRSARSWPRPGRASSSAAGPSPLTLTLTLAFGIGTVLRAAAAPRAGRGRHGSRPCGTLVQHLLEGVIRVVVFVGYLLLISRSGEIRRVFQYHGAEHMTIHALEHGDPLTPERRPPVPHRAPALRHGVPAGRGHRQHRAVQPACRQELVVSDRGPDRSSSR